MTQYVDAQLDPIVKRLDDHAAFHLANAVATGRLIVTNVIMAVACLGTLAGVIVSIVRH